MSLLKRCWFAAGGQDYLADLLYENGDVVLLLDQDAHGDKLGYTVHVKLDPALLEELSIGGPVHYRYRGPVAFPQKDAQ